MHNEHLSASVFAICFGVTCVAVGFSLIGFAAM